MFIVGNGLSVIASELQNVIQNQSVQKRIEFNDSCCRKKNACDNQLVSQCHISVQVVNNTRIQKCPYVCCFCWKRFMTSTKLLQHLKHHNHHMPLKSVIYPGTEVDRNKDGCDVNGASITDDVNLVTCKECSRQFRTRMKLGAHIRSFHKVLRRRCPQCGDRCNSARELKSHLRDSHAAATTKNVGDACGRRSDRSVDLSSRRLSRDGLETCSRSEVEAGSHSRSRHCKDCGADDFKTWRCLLLHRRTLHGGRLPHACPHCPRQFLYASELRKHERRHTRHRPHVCSVCGKSFRHPADLEVHGRVHRGDAPLTCTVCNRWMSSMTGLRAHMRIHRPNAPASVCNVCNKQFSYLSSLRTHMKRQHAAAAGKSSWRCSGCNSEFSSQLLLDEHVSVRHSSTLFATLSTLLWSSGLVVVVVVLSSVDVGDPRCPIHVDDAIFTHII